MTDSERIALVEWHRLDVYYIAADTPRATRVPVGWVVDLGDADDSLWNEGAGDGGTSLVVGAATWRDAVDAAKQVLDVIKP